MSGAYPWRAAGVRSAGLKPQGECRRFAFPSLHLMLDWYIEMRLYTLFFTLIAVAASAAAQPASLAGFQDDGTFFLVLNEQRLGTSHFTWKPDGSFSSEMTISLAGQTAKQSLQVIPGPDGHWTQLIAQTPLGEAKAIREGDKLTRTLKDKSTIVTVKDGSVLFDNNSPALLAVAVKKYGDAKGADIPIIVAPGADVDGKFEKTDQLERAVAGKTLQLTRYTLTIKGVDLNILAGGDGKIYLVDVPAQHAYFVREGYDALHVEPVPDPLLSAPAYKVAVERNIQVPMRDGIKLVADVYKPAGAEGKLPVVLVRTPYKKELNELQGNYFARRGYAYVVQDVRGRFGSPGVWEPFLNEAKDGYDTIEWFAKQPWASGKVGMIGASYLGWVQWLAAAQKPPHLSCIIPNVAPPDPFFNVPYEYGAFYLFGALWWADIVQSNATADISGAAILKTGDRKYTKLLSSLPVIDLDKSVMGGENKFWREWIQHPNNDDYWDRGNHLDRLKDVNIPAFHQSGWFDGDGIGTKLNYLRMAAHNAPNQKLVLGPWPHSDQSTRFLMGRDFGPEALMDLNVAYLRWFDHWLKGVDNGIEREPLVQMFVMGSNKWVKGARYPLSETKFEKWYLADGGKLTTDPPPAGAKPDKYTYDPGDPTPDPRLYEDLYEGKDARTADALKKEQEAYHDSVLSRRKDILVYTTDPFKEPYTFAGPLSAVLYASTSAKDTDWFVNLFEIDKDGKYFWLGKGVIRARYRKSTHKPEFVKPGEVTEYSLDVWHTGITIPPGSKLRVEVSSALFPTFSRNLNTGGHNETETKFVSAEQEIYHDARHPSHILLPAIPAP